MDVKEVNSMVSANVRAEFARYRVSPSQMAERIGISESGITKKLAGTNPFTVAELLALAEVMNVPLARFVAPPTDLNQ